MIVLMLMPLLLVALGFWQFARWSAYKHYGLEKAWEHRKKIAEITAEINRDAEAPDRVVKIANLFADVTFNDEVIRKVRALSKSKVKQKEHSKAPSIRKELVEEMGEKYGSLVHELIVHMSHTIMYSDIKWARRYHDHQVNKNRAREVRKIQATEIASHFLDNHGLPC